MTITKDQLRSRSTETDPMADFYLERIKALEADNKRLREKYEPTHEQSLAREILLPRRNHEGE